MKKTLAVALAVASFSACAGMQDSLKNEVSSIDQSAVDATHGAVGSLFHHESAAAEPVAAPASDSGSAAPAAPAASADPVVAYQNYDFKPGKTVIFDDGFSGDQDGEFPAHWVFKAGAAVVNKVQGRPALLFTTNNSLVTPRMKRVNYLSDPFTVEFDYYVTNGDSSGPTLTLTDAQGQDRTFAFGREVTPGFFQNSNPTSDTLPEAGFDGQWHHAALIYRHHQIKAYIDNMRALVAPDAEIVPARLEMGVGFATDKTPCIFRDFRIAAGGASNEIGAELSKGRLVTHGITFEPGKDSLRPESMGVLNDVAGYLKEHSGAKYEIEGFTDDDGSAASNLALSRRRAEAVKDRLVAMGVSGSRLRAKGLGESHPISPNATPEGKANNRRVEFVRL